MEDFGAVQVFTGVPEQATPTMSQASAPTAMSSVEQSRAIAEVQAAMVVARMNPRDEQTSYMKIIQACKRLSLAEKAKFAYKRGGTLVTGPTIRLAEVLIGYWGNCTYGFRELARTGDASEVEAFAWDLETNVRSTRTFQVRHYRDKRDGAEKITAERDKYEWIAGMAQRRVRACILELIPGDIVEAAERQCDQTLAKGDGRPISDRVRDMLVAFADLGVTKDMIEAYVQHETKGIVPQELVRLTEIYRSIKDGIAPASEFFKPSAPTAVAQQKKSAPEQESEYQCAICGFVAQSERGLKLHTTRSHGEPEPDEQKAEDLEIPPVQAPGSHGPDSGENDDAQEDEIERGILVKNLEGIRKMDGAAWIGGQKNARLQTTDYNRLTVDELRRWLDKLQ